MITTELEIINKYGAMGSIEVQTELNKSLASVIRILNDLEQLNLIKILVFSSLRHRHRIYIKNEIYNNINRITEPKG